MLTVRQVSREERPAYQARIAALERGITYPLGEDFFEIDHGDDYFAFFDRLGEPSYWVALDGERVVAVGAGVLRTVPGAGRTWYGCDLKVHADYRDRRIPLQMALRGFPLTYPRCPHGYGISMNPGDGSENRVVRLLLRMRLVPVTVGPILEIFSLDADAMRAAAPRLASTLGPLSYLSLGGIKDIVLRSTGAPMPLLHVQHGPCAARGLPEPVDGHVHMFCAPAGDPDVAALGLRPSATATVLQHRMVGWDWRFVLTSDI